MDPRPEFSIERHGDDAHVILSGAWTSSAAESVESQARRITQETADAKRVWLDMERISRLDTLGAWVLDRTRHELGEAGRGAQYHGLTDTQKILLGEAAWRDLGQAVPRRGSPLVDMLADVGSTVVGAGKDLAGGISFLGAVVAALGRVMVKPWRFRFTSLIFQLEQVGLRSVPIICLISFLVGCIVSQQSIFQLRRFGATAFVVDLIGILTLRELGVLLTSIMVAGRSGSAFTAEIGSMKMREEIDALRVMGLDPIEVLVVPRILALMLALPMLAFLADLAALFGGGLVAWLYGGISQEVFVERLRSSIGLNTFLVGLIKAPFMALVVGLIACVEGLAVKGSAESLGRQVTSSVVKGIFMVIVVDGVFAMFFAAIRY